MISGNFLPKRKVLKLFNSIEEVRRQGLILFYFWNWLMGQFSRLFATVTKVINS